MGPVQRRLSPSQSATRPAGRCADGGAEQTLILSLLWDPLSVETAAFLVQSLSLVTERGNGSDRARGGRSRLSPILKLLCSLIWALLSLHVKPDNLEYFY